MGLIQQLPEEIAIKIAAGEVVERPASVVKELVENALDAGATEIVVTLEQGGKALIEVRDNGSGMDREDAEKSFLRHGTSKVRSVEDLLHVMTLGFRGEALAAIAASAEGQLVTAQPEASEGAVVAFSHGVVVPAKPHAPVPGTTLTVRNLFSALPARQKFLKAEATEWKSCLEVITKQAIAHSAVAFTIIHNKRTVYTLPANQSFCARVAQVWDIEEGQLISIASEAAHMKVQGVVARPEVAHLFKSRQFLSINGHPVSDKTIHRSVRDAFGTHLPPSLQPTYALTITLHPGMVDVNIHPRKDEVRFVNSQELFRFVWQAVSQALEREAKPFRVLPPTFQAPSVSGTPVPAFSLPRPAAEWGQRKPSEPRPALDFSSLPSASVIVASETSDLAPPSSSGPVLVVDNCYLVTVLDGKLLLVDQHAAHERILYNQLWEQDQAKAIVRQPLLVPAELSLSEEQRIRLEEYKEILSELGFVLTSRDGAVTVTEVPHLASRTSPDRFLADILAGLGDDRPEAELETRKHKVFTTMACKAAVKAGDVLSEREKQQLIVDLLATPTRFTCPHGRPSHIEITAHSLEKLFKRTGF